MIPRGSFAAHVTSRKGRGASDSNSNRSGSDPQVDQPFVLADFLTKAAHPRAVCRLHPHGGREVTVRNVSTTLIQPGPAFRLDYVTAATGFGSSEFVGTEFFALSAKDRSGW